LATTTVTTTDPTTYEFDVALSYAGEDRTYVVSVAERLRNQGVAVFFAEFAQADLWGTDLYQFFDDVFRKRARFAMLFVSRHYISKSWMPNPAVRDHSHAVRRHIVQSVPPS
jgi:hypothetical protein